MSKKKSTGELPKLDNVPSNSVADIFSNFEPAMGMTQEQAKKDKEDFQNLDIMGRPKTKIKDPSASGGGKDGGCCTIL